MDGEFYFIVFFCFSDWATLHKSLNFCVYFLINFCLLWVIVASSGLSLVVVSGGHSLIAVHGVLVALVSFVAEHGL